MFELISLLINIKLLNVVGYLIINFASHDKNKVRDDAIAN